MLCKIVVVFSSLLAFTLANVIKNDPIPIVSLHEEVNPDGSFQWSFEGADGTAQQQTAEVHHVAGDKDKLAETVHGSVTWTDPDGHKHEIVYTADENGFRPESADIPVAPPVPEGIQKGLDWIKTHPPTTTTTIKEVTVPETVTEVKNEE